MSDLSKKTIEGNYRIAQVEKRFNTGDYLKMTEYYALFDEDIFEGDSVIYEKEDGMRGIGRVYNIREKEDIPVNKLPIREIITKVDFSDYEYRKESRSRLSALKNKMDEILRVQQPLLLYKELAKTSPEMKELLAEYEDLANEVNLL